MFRVLILALTVAASYSVVAAQSYSLVNYVALVMQKSDQALAIDDKLTMARLDLENIKQDYAFQWVPSVSLGLTNDTDNQGFGFEVRKQTEFGTQYAVGTSYDKFNSDFSSSTSPTAYLRVEQGLFRNWGSDIGRLPLTKAEIASKRTYWSTVAEKQSLLRRAVQEYFSVLVAKQQLKLKEASVERAQKNLEVSESRYGLGLVPKIDIYRANLALLSAIDSQKSEERSLNRNYRSLATLIKQDDSSQVSIIEDVLLFDIDIPDDFLNIALNYRSDWKRFILDERVAQLDLMRAEKQLMPDIRLNLSAKQYFDEFNTGNGDLSDEVDWRIGLSYSTPFNQTRENNDFTRQQIRVNEQKRAKQALKRRILQELQDTIDDIRLAEDRLNIAKQRLEQSEKAVELSQLRYQRGLSSNLDLVDAENELQSAQIETLRQQINLNTVTVLFAEKLGILDVKWLERTITTH